MPKALDIGGRRFGRLLVISRAQVTGARNVMWHCKCDCGNMTVAAAANIGRTTLSCGCLAKETAASILRTARYSFKHGMSKSAEHRIWSVMHQRCYNPNNHKYLRYGGRGIEICKRWRDSFQNFYVDMGPRPTSAHSIERKDNNGNYEPKNCVWATIAQQSRNTRTNKFITIDGITLCVVDWCKAMNIPRWKANELTRGRGRSRKSPPRCASIEDAIRLLHREHSR
jgi:hypothetical protein